MSLLAGKEEGDRTIQSLFRALKIVEYVAEHGNLAGLMEISKGLDINKSTAHGLIATLEKCGYMRQDAKTGKYSLGIKVFELGQAYITNLDLRQIALPYLKELSLTYQETTHLAVLSGEDVVYIEKVDGLRSVGIRSQVGGRNPAYCTGVGKVLLSGLDKQQIENLYYDHVLQEYTSNTVKDLPELICQIQQVRKQGYAFDSQEFEQDLQCVAAPIKDSSGTIIAAISLSGPASRLLASQMDGIAIEVVRTAKKISLQLGFRD
ncbi:HTH-type transcriptional regulator XynR [Sporomusa silvacetica DSM 10669]|uniref:HTH-type transcriptional regulator XynR n=1 Tax=Sporomusa silvacetica DSM 10669 TaxID=1123289 RepID=A0ABZ3IG09_9FIRM|nr:IclR family transcriptional regulator [Sporomusa silvacetica]OZC16469.1 transcriptional regulator KdgR [Sporomusa silvacetica DSM 10669]